MDLNIAGPAEFADIIRWAVITGIGDAEKGAAPIMPTALLERAQCTGSLDQATALHTAYMIGRKHFDWSLNKHEVERAPERRSGMAVQQQMISPLKQRPQAHVEVFPRSAATGRPAMSVPIAKGPAPIVMSGVKAPWK